MKAMAPDEIRAFAARWKLAAEAERAELRLTPLSEKLRQLATLMASACAMNWEMTDPVEVEKVRARWLRLREPIGLGPPDR